MESLSLHVGLAASQKLWSALQNHFGGCRYVESPSIALSSGASPQVIDTFLSLLLNKPSYFCSRYVFVFAYSCLQFCVGAACKLEHVEDLPLCALAPVSSGLCDPIPLPGPAGGATIA